jgi:hypothetical protein
MEFSFLNGQAFEKTKRLQYVFILKCPALLLLLFFFLSYSVGVTGQNKKKVS